MSTYNICFYGELKQSILELSSNISPELYSDVILPNLPLALTELFHSSIFFFLFFFFFF